MRRGRKGGDSVTRISARTWGLIAAALMLALADFCVIYLYASLSVPLRVLGWTLPVLVIFSAYTGIFQKGRGLGVLRRCFIGVCLAATGALTGALAWNGLMDSAVPSRHPARIVGTRSATSKYKTNSWAVFEFQRDGVPWRVPFSVPQGWLAPGYGSRDFELWISPGALRVPWLYSIQEVPRVQEGPQADR